MIMFPKHEQTRTQSHDHFKLNKKYNQILKQVTAKTTRVQYKKMLAVRYWLLGIGC